ncbi:MAG TPA: type IV pilin protein [Rubrivivax sp.]
MQTPWCSRHARGMTLVDLMLTLAVTGVIAAVALPAYQAPIAKSQRADAVLALTRVQAAQEQFRSHHGSYALALNGLRGTAPSSPGGHYEIALLAPHAGGYTARALPRDTALHDPACPELRLTVNEGLATFGPSARCWNR